jgi:HEAT repeat protein
MNKPVDERVEHCMAILEKSSDNSLKVEALWILADSFAEILPNSPQREQIGKFLESVLDNDKSAVVKHEACYVIGENNLRKQIPNLQRAALGDQSELVRHEAVEALGLLQDFGSEPIIKKALNDPSLAVKETAEVVLKQLERAKRNDLD